MPAGVPLRLTRVQLELLSEPEGTAGKGWERGGGVREKGDTGEAGLGARPRVN